MQFKEETFPTCYIRALQQLSELIKNHDKQPPRVEERPPSRVVAQPLNTSTNPTALKVVSTQPWMYQCHVQQNTPHNTAKNIPNITQDDHCIISLMPQPSRTSTQHNNVDLLCMQWSPRLYSPMPLISNTEISSTMYALEFSCCVQSLNIISQAIDHFAAACWAQDIPKTKTLHPMIILNVEYQWSISLPAKTFAVTKSWPMIKPHVTPGQWLWKRIWQFSPRGCQDKYCGQQLQFCYVLKTDQKYP